MIAHELLLNDVVTWALAARAPGFHRTSRAAEVFGCGSAVEPRTGLLGVEDATNRALDHVDRVKLHLQSPFVQRSEEHTSELQSLMRNSYAVFCLKHKKIELDKHHN